MIDKIIIDYIKDNLNKDVTIVKRLLGGLSNYTYLIEIENELYTFRIPGKGSENFTNRYSEFECVKHAEKLKLIPKALINDVITGYKVTPYVDGPILSEIFPKPVEAVAGVLKTIHNSKKFEHDYNPLQRLNYFEMLINNDDPVYLALKEKWEEIYEKKLAKIELLPCHGDAQTSNFVIAKNRLYLLDWEYSANNDPIYDIACFGNSDFDNAKQLLEEYFMDANANQYERLYAWRMYQCLQWHNIAKYKHEIGLSEDLAIDFKSISDNYLDQAKGFFEDYLNIGNGD